MRAGLSAIQQTLAPEVVSVLTRAVEDAAGRKHGQTTPLHVAATLLSAPSGLLRMACMSSHPDSARPLRCRALELCFSVALDRLASDGRGAVEPPISNALKTALKRAQANQRRRCPEQPLQPPPLLAVKVEMEQLLISILDDPSVSRVMREASFSSAAVKAAVERSLSYSSSSSASTTVTSAPSTTPSPTSPALSSPFSAGFLGLNLNARAAPLHNIYMNPRLHQHRPKDSGAAGGGTEQPRAEEVKQVMDILCRSTKRNPVLVGDVDLDATVKEVMQTIESGAAPRELRIAKVVSFSKELAPAAAGDASWIITRIREMGNIIESEIAGGRGVIFDLGDLKWLVESPGWAPTTSLVTRTQQVVCSAGRAAEAEIGRLLEAFKVRGPVWLFGTATCTTYLRCQVYHPTIEKDWDLQVVQIAPRTHILARFDANSKFTSSIDSPATPTPRIGLLDSASSSGSTRHELAKEMDKSSSKVEDNIALPPWLQLAKLGNGGSSKPSTDHLQKQRKEELLLKKWQTLESGLNLTLSQNHESITFNPSSEQPSSPPASPVKTELVLGNSNSSTEKTTTHKARLQDLTKSMQPDFANAKFASVSDIDAFKRLFKGLVEKVSWQQDAASAIATVILQWKSENRKRPWLLFIGPDRVGKQKMAAAVSQLVFRTAPTTINLGGGASYGIVDDEESIVSSRGRTSMDRLVDAVRRNPFSVIVLENVDRADGLVKGSIKRAMEQGRLVNSYGREVGLGNVIFIITSYWLPEELERAHDLQIQSEERILDSACRQWQLELSAEKNHPGKRGVDWLWNSGQPVKLRRQSSPGLSLDLNLAMAAATPEDEEHREGSRNSSDITTDHESDKGRRLALGCSKLCPAAELIELVDTAILFKPVDFAPLRWSVADSISRSFAAVMGAGCSIKIDEDAVDRIVGGLWLAGEKLDEWSERVLSPSLKQLKHSLRADDESAVTVRLSAVTGPRGTANGDRDWLPATTSIAIEGL